MAGNDSIFKAHGEAQETEGRSGLQAGAEGVDCEDC